MNRGYSPSDILSKQSNFYAKPIDKYLTIFGKTSRSHSAIERSDLTYRYVASPNTVFVQEAKNERETSMPKPNYMPF